MEKSAFDVLMENLIELGFEAESSASSKHFIYSGSGSMLNSKYVFAALSDSMCFFASDSFGSKTYSSTFSGIYTPIETSIDMEYKVIRKDWIDPFFYRKIRKTGISYIDKKLTILSPNWNPSRELDRDSVDMFLTMNKQSPFSLLVKNDYLPVIKMLKGKKVLGIETNKWVYEKEDLKNLISSGQVLLNKIKQAINNNR